MSFTAAYDELLKFLEGYKLEGVFAKNDLGSSFKKSFKKVYPVLILERAIEKSGPFKDKTKSAKFNLYLYEAISDLMQSLMIGVQGFYKPALLTLRSALENCVKCIGLFEDQNVLSITSVYDLMDVVKDTNFVSTNAEAKRAFRQIRGEYADLCGYVHTSSAAHMALTKFAGKFPRALPKDAQNLFGRISSFSTQVTKILILMFTKQFRALHHTHFDTVCDALPLSFKRQLNVKGAVA